MLELSQVYKTFNPGTINEKVALRGIDLTLKDGDFVTVIGGNGAGKSTIIKSIVGIQPITEGEIEICGYDAQKQSSIPYLHERSCGYVYRYQLSHCL